MNPQPLTLDSRKELSLRGMLALATRAARRAQPVFVAWVDSAVTDEAEAAKLLKDVEIALRHGEAFALATHPPHDLAETDVQTAHAARKACERSFANSPAAGAAAEPAFLVANAVVSADNYVQNTSRPREMGSALVAADYTFMALQRASDAAPESEKQATLDAILSDYAALVAMRHGPFPNLGDAAQLD
jgi:hypothetical protein